MQAISTVTVVVPDYEEAIAFYVGKLGFVLRHDAPLPEGRRWVVVVPEGAHETGLLLAKAEGSEQLRAIGNQTGGRVFLFLKTDDFDRDYRRYKLAGIEFLEQPRAEACGKVAVFRDPFGNRWDLIGSGPA